jgi:aryl-alcohol dehydrogenase-like predicted oxidoreductase
LKAAGTLRAEAEKPDLNGHHAALRWVLYHSALKEELGDGMVLSAGTLEQHKGNLAACDSGPLPSNIVSTIDHIWPDVERLAPWAWMGNMSDDLIKVSKTSSPVEQSRSTN